MRGRPRYSVPMRITYALASLLFLISPAFAEVVDSSASGFTVQIAVEMPGKPADAYNKFLRIGEWWDKDHTYSGDSKNLTLDDHAPGCLCEKIPESGGTVQHMQVVRALPGTRIVMNGGLGPLQTMAATGALTVSFTPSQTGTRLTLTYAVAGYSPQGLNTLAAPVNGVLETQVERFRSFATTGKPAAAGKPAP